MKKIPPKDIAGRNYQINDFIQRIEQIMDEKGLKDQNEFNRIVGIQRAITRWKTRETSPKIDSLIAIRNYSGKSIDWLLFGEEGKGKQPLQPIITLAGAYQELPGQVQSEHYLAVPLVNGLVGAGYDGAIPGDYIDHFLWVYRPELGARQHHGLRAIRIADQADSMAPTIRPGDIVIVDPEEKPSQRPLSKKAIYAVRLDEHGHAALKRVREVDHYWLCLSDNLNYNPILIKKSERPNLIIGQVIWSWTSWVR